MDDGDLARPPEKGPEQKATLDAPLDSLAIRRLIEEVRTEEFDIPRSYNRTYNRHNR